MKNRDKISSLGVNEVMDSLSPGYCLPRDSHRGIQFSYMNIFSCSKDRSNKVKGTSQNACSFLLTFALSPRFQGKMGNQSYFRHLKEWKSPVLLAACDFCSVKREAEKQFTWGHFSHCSFLSWIIAVCFLLLPQSTQAWIFSKVKKFVYLTGFVAK